jgi:hypothetical protein
VGVFIDKPRRRVYIFPLPCLGIVIDLGQSDESDTPALPQIDCDACGHHHPNDGRCG